MLLGHISWKFRIELWRYSLFKVLVEVQSWSSKVVFTCKSLVMLGIKLFGQNPPIPIFIMKSFLLQTSHFSYPCAKCWSNFYGSTMYRLLNERIFNMIWWNFTHWKKQQHSLSMNPLTLIVLKFAYSCDKKGLVHLKVTYQTYIKEEKKAFMNRPLYTLPAPRFSNLLWPN